VPRVISFIVLLAIVLLVGAFFFQVMAQFVVPLFLACVLLVVFQPLHGWMLEKLPKHPRFAALFTTIVILLVVLLPLVWLGWNAYVELHSLFRPGPKANATQQQSESKPSRPSARTVETSPAQPTVPLNNAPESGEQVEEKALTGKVNEIALQFRDKIYEYTRVFIPDKNVTDSVEAGTKILAAKAVSGVQNALGVLVGLVIMVIALYYFLADGPAMIETVMDLSPLDYKYEQELLTRFGEVSRAVVVATLLSAVVQGALAGIGYYFALPASAPIFLLIATTMVTALVPFVGAAATWICVCAWVALHGSPTTAMVLAAYCTVVVSGIDNVIKPLILHGQSKLHPLLALLSILGGVQALGPVGILVGPMLVSFLQALLNMLRKELDSFGGPTVDGSKPLAESVADAVQMVTDQTADHPTKAIDGARATAKSPPEPRKGRFGRAKRKR
jgi:predicted PurR-regulated permease PerM